MNFQLKRSRKSLDPGSCQIRLAFEASDLEPDFLLQTTIYQTGNSAFSGRKPEKMDRQRPKKAIKKADAAVNDNLKMMLRLWAGWILSWFGRVDSRPPKNGCLAWFCSFLAFLKGLLGIFFLLGFFKQIQVGWFDIPQKPPNNTRTCSQVCIDLCPDAACLAGWKTW